MLEDNLDPESVLEFVQEKYEELLNDKDWVPAQRPVDRAAPSINNVLNGFSNEELQSKDNIRAWAKMATDLFRDSRGVNRASATKNFHPSQKILCWSLFWLFPSFQILPQLLVSQKALFYFATFLHNF